MKKTMICAVSFFLVMVLIWLFLAYKALPLVCWLYSSEIAASLYSEELEWMKGKSEDEIKDRFGPFDISCRLSGDGYYLSEDDFLVCDTLEPKVDFLCSEYCHVHNKDGVFTLQKNFQKPWMLYNLCASVIVCGGMCFVTAAIFILRKKKKQ